MIVIWVLSIALVVGVVMLHFEGLTLINRFALSRAAVERMHLMLVIVSLLLLHVLEICVFAFGIYIAHHLFHLGNFAGEREFVASDYFHFSAETFTTVGYGDLYPIGSLRVLASMESLTGVLLIAWSGAFSYFTVQRLWDAAAHEKAMRPARRARKD
ncbi:MAG: two pore domain potassium channel family protein [Alphaproteobacteria bacterium]|nr:two pore domain potassium channel family protein [Alphaproteobacteria bacterium]USO07437.1 MAG: two pore domain potassium channel family protein [Rhodospirillales bacterium]